MGSQVGRVTSFTSPQLLGRICIPSFQNLDISFQPFNITKQQGKPCAYLLLFSPLDHDLFSGKYGYICKFGLYYVLVVNLLLLCLEKNV
jgi:hypothetical protein